MSSPPATAKPVNKRNQVWRPLDRAFKVKSRSADSGFIKFATIKQPPYRHALLSIESKK